MNIFIIVCIVAFIAIFLAVMSISGIVSYFVSSFRPYRRILIDMSLVYAAVYSGMLYWSVTVLDYHLQQNVLMVGGLVLFALSPFVKWIRKHPFWTAVIWSTLCTIWLWMAPIEVDLPSFFDFRL
jgi:Na+/melibiose symporter-like transporter